MRQLQVNSLRRLAKAAISRETARTTAGINPATLAGIGSFFVPPNATSKRTVVAIDGPCNTFKNPQGFCFFSTNRPKRGPHDQEILKLLDSGRINYKQLDDAFDKAFQETRVVLQLNTFFKLVLRFQSYKDPKAAAVLPAFILGWMMKFNNQKRLDMPPKVDLFGMALNCLAKSKHPLGGEIAEQFLYEIEKLIEQEKLGFHLDAFLYNKTIKAFAVRGNTEKAQAIFDRCMKEFEEGNKGARPDNFSWNTLIDAYAKSGKPDAGELALEKLREAEESGLQLNTISYGSVIDAFARSNKPEEAEKILEEMNRVYLDGNMDAQPNVRSFSQVLNAWARTKTLDGAKRSEKILNGMVKLFEDATLPVRPDTISYSTVISAYGRVGLPRDAGRILEKQHADFLDGNHDAQPDVRGFLGVIEGWFNSGESIAGEQAERILDHMDGLHKRGTLKERPNTHIYNSVMKAWGVVGEPQRAEKIFHRMLSDFENGNLAAKPDVFSYTTLLDARARAKLPDAGKLADEVLEQMKQMRIQPNDAVYRTAHRCWHCSKSSDPKRDKRLRELMDMQRKNKHTYRK